MHSVEGRTNGGGRFGELSLGLELRLHKLIVAEALQPPKRFENYHAACVLNSRYILHRPRAVDLFDLRFERYLCTYLSAIMDDAPATAGTESSPASRSRVSGPPRIHVEIPTSSLSEGDNYQPGSDRYAISPMDQPSHGSEGLQSTANSPHQSESEPRSVSSVRGRGEGESIEGPSVTTNHRTSPNTGNGGRYDVPKENQNPDEGHARLAELWIPWSLRCRFLISNCLLFAVFIVVLEVLYSISQRHNGLASSEEKLYYLWTYGPTASRYITP
jgi:hypothetical protein